MFRIDKELALLGSRKNQGAMIYSNSNEWRNRVWDWYRRYVTTIFKVFVQRAALQF